jgi:hypothetical protein
MKLPSKFTDLMKCVEETYMAFFKLWNMTMVPMLMKQPKWYKSSENLKPNDFVIFQKEESDLTSRWTVGQVDSVTNSKDGIVRSVDVRYHNSKESEPSFTTRAVCSLLRLFNVDEVGFQQEMAEVERLVFDLDETSSYRTGSTN